MRFVPFICHSRTRGKCAASLDKLVAPTAHCSRLVSAVLTDANTARSPGLGGVRECDIATRPSEAYGNMASRLSTASISDATHSGPSAPNFQCSACTVKISKGDRLQPIFDHNLRIWYQSKRVCVPFWVPLAAEGPSHAPFELLPTPLLWPLHFDLVLEGNLISALRCRCAILSLGCLFSLFRFALRASQT